MRNIHLTVKMAWQRHFCGIRENMVIHDFQKLGKDTKHPCRLCHMLIQL
ncbi:hypothetical protein ABIC22_002114 [Paenibacillus sp. PvP094]